MTWPEEEDALRPTHLKFDWVEFRSTRISEYAEHPLDLTKRLNRADPHSDWPRGRSLYNVEVQIPSIIQSMDDSDVTWGVREKNQRHHELFRPGSLYLELPIDVHASLGAEEFEHTTTEAKRMRYRALNQPQVQYTHLRTKTPVIDTGEERSFLSIHCIAMQYDIYPVGRISISPMLIYVHPDKKHTCFGQMHTLDVDAHRIEAL